MSFRGGNRGNWRGGHGGSRPGPPPAKKFRAEDDEDDEGARGSFEDRLAGMLEEEDELLQPSTAMEEPIECHEERFVRWRRPAPPPLDAEKDTLIFQQIDINHYIGKPYRGMPGAQTGVVPIMRMFGVTKAVSICFSSLLKYPCTL